MPIAAALTLIVNLILNVEAFNINHGTVPSNMMKNVPKNAIQGRFLYGTRLSYQKGETRSYKPIPSKQYHYFMEELQGRDEIVARATTKPLETKDMEQTLDIQNFELEMEYQMAELEYLFKSTYLEENREECSSDDRLQLTTATTPSEDILVPNDDEATLFLEKITTETYQEDDNTKHQTTKSHFFSFLSDVWFARIIVLISAALYGTNFTMVKLLDETVPVGISTTLRFGIAALTTLPWLIAPPTPPTTVEEELLEHQSKHYDDCLEGRQEEDSMTKRLRKAFDGPTAISLGAAFMGFEVGVWNSIGYVAQAVGLQTTDASKSAFICSLAVVVVPILDFLSGKNLPPRKAAGAAMAIAGVGFLEFGGMTTPDFSISSGDILSLVQPLAFGVGFWRMERAMHKYPTEAARMTAGQIFAVFVVSAAYCMITGVSDAAALPSIHQLASWITDPVILGQLFWTGTVTTAFTVYMETLALKTLSAAETTLLFSTEPLWGAAFAAFVVGERFGFSSVVGAFFILSGCIFSNLSSINAVVDDGLLSPPIGTVISGANSDLIYGELAADTTTSSTGTIIVADAGGKTIGDNVRTHTAP